MGRKALLVGVEYYKMNYKLDESLQELAMLAKACDIEDVAMLTQKLDEIDSKFHVGSGKVEEILNTARALEVDMIIFNEELTPLQLKNLDEILEDFKVTDRTELILDIFKSRAKTREAKLQVEVARLRYLLPRLVGASEQMIGQQGGSGFRGAGEKQIELDRRKIRHQISQYDKELEEMVKQRQTQRLARSKNEIKTVALVGYTNSGKSTLMNRFLSHSLKEDKQVFAKDMLFATLETSTRMIELEDKKRFILIDTVGFVDLLPHHLVKAFRSTLEEVIEADLLIHVVDSTSDHYLKNAQVTNQVLAELGVKDIPMIYVYNKIDEIGGRFLDSIEGNIELSAKTGYNFDVLIQRIKDVLFSDYVECELILPYDKGDIYSLFNENAKVIESKYLEEGIYIRVECSQAMYYKYQQYIIQN